MKSRLLLMIVLCSVFLGCSAKNRRKEVLLGEYTISIAVPPNFRLIESPYEEGKYIHFLSPTGSSFFLFKGGLVQLPIINRDSAGIKQTIQSQDSFSEFGKRDSVYF